MKKWEEYLVAGVIVSIIGVTSLVWASNMYFPSSYRTFLGIPYQVNPEYVDALQQYLALILFGWSFLCLGLGILGCTAEIYNLEKKLTPPPPPPPQNH